MHNRNPVRISVYKCVFVNTMIYECLFIGIITLKGVFIMAVKRQNITVDPVIFEEFCNYAGRQGIKISTWITIKMKEFVEEQKLLEELKNKK
jgi:hypothetical protein